MTSSTATLTSIRDRVEAGLMDAANLSFDTGTLDESIRRALQEISLVYGTTPLTLNGLDSAAATTVSKEDEGALVAGGQAYAGLSRAVDRVETPSLAENAPALLLAWAQAAQCTFLHAIEAIRRRKLQQSACAPHAELCWDEEQEEQW